MQKIANIEIKNFKSIRHQKIEGCKRINVFIGYPNVGKSNILEALGLYSIDSYNDLLKLVRLENSTSLFFNGNISEEGKVVINSNNRISLTYMSDCLRLTCQINKGSESFDTLDKFIETIDLASIMTVDFQHKNLAGKAFSGIDFSNSERALNSVYKYQFENGTKFISTASNNLSAPFGENIFDVISSDISTRKEVGEISRKNENLIVSKLKEENYTVGINELING